MSAADYQRPHYAPGVPAVVALPTQPLSTVLDDAAKRFPQRIAVDFLGTNITYAQLHTQVQRAAAPSTWCWLTPPGVLVRC